MKASKKFPKNSSNTRAGRESKEDSKPVSAMSSYPARLKKLRQEIDEVDRDLIRALARRFRVVERIGRLKRVAGDSVVQKKRRAEIFRDRKARGEKMGLNPKFVQKAFELIQEEAVACQKKVLGGAGKKKRRR